MQSTKREREILKHRSRRAEFIYIRQLHRPQLLMVGGGSKLYYELMGGKFQTVTSIMEKIYLMHPIFKPLIHPEHISHPVNDVSPREVDSILGKDRREIPSECHVCPRIPSFVVAVCRNQSELQGL